MTDDREGRLPDDDRMQGRSAQGQQGPRRPYPGYAGRGHRAAAVPPALLQNSAQRRISELLLPAAVILSGVLVVVAFAFVVSRAMQDDDRASQSIPLPAPPALGDVPPLAPTDQSIIPPPSEPPSEAPEIDPPAPPPTTTKPPPAYAISIARDAVPSRVDLSGEGRLDWVHWGEQNPFSLERASGGDFKILEGAPTAPRQRHGDSPQRFAWSGGSPVERSDGSRVGIRTCGEDNGFTLSVPATRGERTLRLYLGVQDSKGKLTAKLSTGGDSRTSRLEKRGGEMATAMFTVTYRAPKDGRLELSWATEEAFTSDCSGVSIQAATLR